MPILSLNQVSRLFGSVQIFANVSLQIERGDRLALVGANGAGKTTMLRLMAGLDKPDAGTVTTSRGLKIGYLPQEAHFRSDRTLKEALLNVFSTLRRQAARLHELEAQLAASGSNPADWQPAVLEEYTTLMARFEEHGGYTYENRVEQVLSGLGFPRDSWDRPAHNLSGGQRTRAHLARLLLESPDLLLLDEPTNHLDLTTTEWLENFLSNWSGGLVIVSHDRYFLDRTTRRTIELINGSLEQYPAPYSRYVELRAERYARHDREFRAQKAEIAKTEDFIRRFKAGQRSKEARGRETRLARVERLHQAPQTDDLHLRLDVSRATGQVILTTLRLRVGFPGKQLLHMPNVQVDRGAKIALIGANGSGKSTLLRTLIGEQPALSGTYQWGVNVEVGYYAQAHEGLDLHHTVLEEIQNVRPMGEEEGRTYLGRFLFSGDDVFKKVGDLSGGERSRVALAKLTLQRANVLLLDEPTNHLDIVARQALESVLRDYPGSLLFVSHDRYFINALANQIWAVEDGIIRMYRGTYNEYLEKRGKGLYQPEQPEPEISSVRRSPDRRQNRLARSAVISAPGASPIRAFDSVRGAVDESLVPVVERLDRLERDERTVLGQIASSATTDLVRLRDLSSTYANLQEGLAAQDDALISALHAMLAAAQE